MSCTMSLFLLRSLSLCVCGCLLPTTRGAPHRQGRQTQLFEAAGVSHSLITAMTGNVLIDARKNIFLVYSHVPNIFEDSDMIVFQTQRGVPYWHGQWKFKQATFQILQQLSWRPSTPCTQFQTHQSTLGLLYQLGLLGLCFQNEDDVEQCAIFSSLGERFPPQGTQSLPSPEKSS